MSCYQDAIRLDNSAETSEDGKLVKNLVSNRTTMVKFKVTVEGDDPLRLQKQVQQFADEFWTADHAINDDTGVVILDAFKRKLLGQLELVEVRCSTSD